MANQQECQFGGETGERVAFGDDGNRSAGADQSAGKLLGGQVMHLVDMAAALAAHRHSNCYVVTASWTTSIFATR